MLRAIMHFREHMLTCLEKENLIDQAQALQELGDIVKDKVIKLRLIYFSLIGDPFEL